MKNIFTLTALCGLLFSANALAVEKPAHKNFGFGIDIGAPAGMAGVFTAKPNLDWLRLSAGLTYNGLAPGVRAGATLDPINFFISPSFTIEAGHSFMGNIPTQSARLDMTYVNFYGGLELGSQKSFRFFLHAGPSYFKSNGEKLDSLFDNKEMKLNNTSVNGWFAPTGEIGFVTFL